METVNLEEWARSVFGSNKILLVGFMGAGKSTVGPLLANALGFEFYDLDHCVERTEKMSLSELIPLRGEEYFRDRESQTLEFLLRQKTPSVLALGGGALLRPENERAAKTYGLRVYLKTDPQVLAKRTLIQKNQRPLLPEESFTERVERIVTLFKARQSAYESSELSVCTDGLSSGEVVDRILDGLLRKGQDSGKNFSKF